MQEEARDLKNQPYSHTVDFLEVQYTLKTVVNGNEHSTGMNSTRRATCYVIV